MSGKIYNSVSYGLNKNGIINYEEIEEKLYEYQPRLLIAGASAYSRVIDFERISSIVHEYNKWQEEEDSKNAKAYNEGKISDLTPESYPQKEHCYFMVDMAHIAGLVAAGLHPSPLPWADVVTSTTQKTLRSGRGGLILTNSTTIAKEIEKAVFPGIIGGPLNNMIAGKAIGFAEALSHEFIEYQKQVLKNIKAMEEVFRENDVDMVSGGSDNHLLLLDLRKEGISGKELEDKLSEIGIVVNKNAINGDTRPKSETSGVRIGTPAITTRGAKEEDCRSIAQIISDIIKGNNVQDDNKLWVKQWCKEHPIYK